ncbi:hypothetical protein GCM10010472_54690 [Pseudonocardia halophobica]|uniref:Uncharacterized protein n=1 Tax=Pseudonocardia halophobica TaxID=29401 RepID=A0A9W6NWK5_9PSEU|nr:hypothetical protein [Pseudonocardia halophobica]GLL11547.1 hypothetical protein GCM10017577_26880 [Pseudonocardia halophobica]
MTGPGNQPDGREDGAASQSSTNSATDGAQVGAQFGFVHGNVNYTYQTRDDSPAEKFRIGRNFLQAGAPGKAAELIEDARARGHDTPEVRFCHALALVSNRSASELALMESRPTLKLLIEQASSAPDDHYQQGLFVIGRILDLVLRRGAPPAPAPAPDRDEVFALYTALARDVRRDIGRHLDRLLAGVAEDEMELRRAEEIDQGRFDGDRRRRARKYFIPDPARPLRRYVDQDPHPIRSWALSGALCIVFALTAGYFLALTSGIGRTVASFLLPALVAAATGAGWGFVGVSAARRWNRLTRTRLEKRRAPRFDDTRIDSREDAKRFKATVRDMYNREFFFASPTDKQKAKQWRKDTEGIRRSLRQECIDLYGSRHRRNPASLEWLARHHAERMRQRWDRAEFKAWPDIYRPDHFRRLAGPVGAVLLLVIAVLLSANIIATASGAGILLWLCTLVAGSGAYVQVASTCASHKVATWQRRETDDELAEATRAFHRQMDYLKDRPSDVEIATWLDFDLRAIRNDALKLYGLRPGDLFTHLALTEGRPDGRRAREPRGPVRYEKYGTKLLLLTENGLRQFEIELDFFTGHLGDRKRLGFHYDKVASATVREAGRVAPGRRLTIISVEDETGNEIEASADETGHLYQQDFIIALVNGSETEIRVENYKDLTEPGEDQARLFELALETSGVRNAMRVMEAVAIEGRDWIQKEKKRHDWGAST